MGILQTLDQLLNILGNALAGWLATFLPAWAVTVILDLLVIVLVLAVALLIVLFLIWMERKAVARFQDRLGPNRAGPFGLLQSFADALKMLTKEDVVPANADRGAFNWAPAIMVAPALLVYAVIPFGRGMVPQDLNIAVLYLLALASMTTIAVLTAGWSSRNKYALLGGLRIGAQLLAYEIPMALSMLTVVLLAGSMSTVRIVEAQARLPFFLMLPGVFLVHFICAAAESNRGPFDLPEAESELVAGFFTEYSGMKFGLFFVAEYINLFAISAILTTLWLGGWQGPILPSWFWFFAKSFAVIFVFMWVRFTLPRFRIDHLLSFAWKFLLPLALTHLFVAGLVVKLGLGFWPQVAVLLVTNVAVTAGALYLGGWGLRRAQQRAVEERLAQWRAWQESR